MNFNVLNRIEIREFWNKARKTNKQKNYDIRNFENNQLEAHFFFLYLFIP